MDNVLVFDLEGDDLLLGITTIHCIVVYDIQQKQFFHYYNDVDSQVYSPFYSGRVAEGIRKLQSADWLVAHNHSGFDCPAIKKLLQKDLAKEVRLFDTILVSQIMDADIRGGKAPHSIEAWASRLNLPFKKIPNEDWSTFTYHMLCRCHSDVQINHEVFLYMKEQFTEWENWENILQLEVDIATIHAQQILNGVTINKLKAYYNMWRMDQRLAELDIQLDKKIPFRCIEGKEESAPFKIDGGYKQRVVNYFAKGGVLPEEVGLSGPYSKVEFNQYDYNSSHQMKACLFTHYNWKPDTFNFKIINGRKERTSPKLTESSFDSLSDRELGEILKERSMLNHRRGTISNVKDPENKGILSYIDSRNRVPANARTCGTPTSRYKHSAPCANVPRPDSPWGAELRELYCVDYGEWMIGVDLSGIEARMMCHYALSFKGGQELADIVLDGDFHSHNAAAWETDRNTAKTALYALD